MLLLLAMSSGDLLAHVEQRAHSLASDTHSRGGRMSEPFGQCMNDISSTLKAVYKAHSAVVIPGSGSVRPSCLLLLALPVFALVSGHQRGCRGCLQFGMEAVARQFGQGKKCMVVRNGCASLSSSLLRL